MSVSVRIPTILRTYTGGESEVSADGATLTEVLDLLAEYLPQGSEVGVFLSSASLVLIGTVVVPTRKRLVANCLLGVVCAEYGLADGFEPTRLSGADLTGFILALVTQEENFVSSEKSQHHSRARHVWWRKAPNSRYTDRARPCFLRGPCS